MEREFDNEIDALLRKEAVGRTITISEIASLHLDADEIAAFAESAVPDSAKQSYMAHFADCDGCRKTLAGVILLNSEAGVETPSAVAAPVAAETGVVWHRKLFLFPNLAYLMGSLVLLFSGFFAISIFRNSGELQISEVSKISSDEPAAGGPNLDYAQDTYYNANASTANSVNSAANTLPYAANAASNSTNTRSPLSAANTAPASADSKAAAPAGTTDAVVTSEVAPAPAPRPKDQPVTMADRNVSPKLEGRRAVPAQEADKQKDDLNAMRETSPAAGGPFKAKGPSRNERSDSRMRENELASKRAAKPESSTASDRKQVNGRSFELKQGVWYDSIYRGQITTNIRRGTDAYKNLESGLRAISELVGGTLVTVWKEKAYRIQ